MLAEKLKRLRDEEGLKQETLAQEIGCTRYMISYYENGREPPLDVLKAYSARFDVSIDWLLDLTNEKKPIGDALTDTIAQLGHIVGDHAPEASSLDSLLNALLQYYKKGARTGDIPLNALNGFIAGLNSATVAVTEENISALIDSTNTTIMAALEVAKMPAKYYESQKKE